MDPPPITGRFLLIVLAALALLTFAMRAWGDDDTPTPTPTPLPVWIQTANAQATARAAACPNVTPGCFADPRAQCTPLICSCSVACFPRGWFPKIWRKPGDPCTCRD